MPNRCRNVPIKCRNTSVSSVLKIIYVASAERPEPPGGVTMNQKPIKPLRAYARADESGNIDSFSIYARARDAWLFDFINWDALPRDQAYIKHRKRLRDAGYRVVRVEIQEAR